ncbi:MFS transporter [Nocardia nova]
MKRVISVPESKHVRVIGAAIFVNTAGGGLFVGISALYFTRIVGFSPEITAFGLAIASAAGIFSGIPLGHLADRVGVKPMQIFLISGMGVCTLAYTFLTSFWQFVLFATISRVLDRGVSAIGGAILAAVAKGTEKVAARAFSATAANLGLAIGTGLSAVVLAIDTPAAYRVAIIVDALSFFASAAMYLWLPRIPRAGRSGFGGATRAVRDLPYVGVVLANSLLGMNGAILTFALPLWIAYHTHAPIALYSALLVVNTTGAVLFQVRVAQRVCALRDAVRFSRIGGLALLAACLLLALSADVSGPITVVILLAGVSVHLVAELLLASASFYTTLELAPGDAQGQYQGLVSTGTAVATLLAPIVMTSLPLRLNTAGWIGLSTLFLGAAYLVGPLARAVQRERDADRQDEHQRAEETEGMIS